MVAGETPYAEGFGDIGGPAWPWGTPAQTESKSLALQAADQAVVDKVCAAVAKCVVLVVSGRPQIVADPAGKIDALVASWLPGSEGAGVADVLFGKQPFTGRLSVTWPRTAAQVPINVGDANYTPLYPFGWGLHTARTTGYDTALDTAQNAVVAGRAPASWAQFIADADHAQLIGDRAKALSLLASVTS